MKVEFAATVSQINPKTKITEGKNKGKEYVHAYFDKITFNAVGEMRPTSETFELMFWEDKTNLLDGILEGQNVVLTCFLSSRDYKKEDKTMYFLSLNPSGIKALSN